MSEQETAGPRVRKPRESRAVALKPQLATPVEVAATVDPNQWSSGRASVAAATEAPAHARAGVGVSDVAAYEKSETGVFLNWPGRRKSRLAVPTPRLLETVLEYSDLAELSPGSLVIEGENCQAMVSLHAQYHGQVDAVLIDVPYNTGKNDFRYSDKRFADPDADGSDAVFVSNEDGGRHTKWLNTMARSLLLTKELMADHGVIFVHISDIELPRLLMLMEEIFDESNHLGTIVWKNATDNNPTRIAIEHEYIVCYAKKIDLVPKIWRGSAAEVRDLMVAEFEVLRADHPDLTALEKAWRKWVGRYREELGEFQHYNRVDERGIYTGMRALHNPGREGYRYMVEHPNGKPVRQPLRGYRFPEERMAGLLADGRIIFGSDETQLLQLKVYLDEAAVSMRGVINLDNRSGTLEIAKLFPENPDIFKNPKPVAIEEYLLSFVADRDALVMDTFAGSGTTAHAVMRLNKRDGGSRRFIMIEEGNADRDDPYATTLTAERLKRARIAENLPGGFIFKRVGQAIDRQAFAEFQRVTVVEAILQSDASGRGSGIRPIDGHLIVGANRRGQAICLRFDGTPDGGVVRSEDLREMFLEAKELGLRKPLRVYGTSCQIAEDETFSFLQIPDEVLANVGSGIKA